MDEYYQKDDLDPENIVKNYEKEELEMRERVRLSEDKRKECEKKEWIEYMKFSCTKPEEEEDEDFVELNECTIDDDVRKIHQILKK